MASVNKVILIGNVGSKPDVSYMPGSNKAVASLSLATTEKWTDKTTGEKKEETEWHRVVFFGKQAETIGRYVDKGSSLYVEGKNKTNKYTDNNGIERYSTSIQAKSFQFLGDKQRQITADDINQNQFVPGGFQQQQSGFNQGNQGGFQQNQPKNGQ